METLHKNAKIVILFAYAGIVAVIWYAVFVVEAGQNLRLTFFDIGQGDSIFIEAPNGTQVLVDGGPGDRVLSKLGEVMPPWDRSIDMLILTHPHADHLDGLLEVLKRYEVTMVMETGVNHTIPEYEEWHRTLQEKNVQVVRPYAGQVVRLSRDATLTILAPFADYEGESPKHLHDSMVVAKLVYGSVEAMLTGDMERGLEFRLMERGADMDADILKAGHHGSKTSSSENFLNAVSPEVVVIQSGRNNRYGHPYQEVLDRFAALGIPVLRNDTEGDIRFVSDGSRFIRR